MPLWEGLQPDAFVGGASAPTLLYPRAATGSKGVGAEAPPTRAPPRCGSVPHCSRRHCRPRSQRANRRNTRSQRPRRRRTQRANSITALDSGNSSRRRSATSLSRACHGRSPSPLAPG
ncbi:DUF6053 domain-containing protein [Lysobacter yananisis]|uniref:DUF6053 domain-containing protein n=1 Tax=Lysobacter yananisis TaxID=1003114 RepID=UPI003CE46571